MHWGRNALSEWRVGFRLRTFRFGLRYVRQRGIEETALSTDYGSPRGAHRFLPNFSVEQPGPCAPTSFNTLLLISAQSLTYTYSAAGIPWEPSPVSCGSTPMRPTILQSTPVGTSAAGEMLLTHQNLEHPNFPLMINWSVHPELHQSVPPFDIALFRAVTRNIYAT